MHAVLASATPAFNPAPSAKIPIFSALDLATSRTSNGHESEASDDHDNSPRLTYHSLVNHQSQWYAHTIQPTCTDIGTEC